MGFRVTNEQKFPDKGLDISNVYSTFGRHLEIKPDVADESKTVLSAILYTYPSLDAYNVAKVQKRRLVPVAARSVIIPITAADFGTNLFRQLYIAAKATHNAAYVADVLEE